MLHILLESVKCNFIQILINFKHRSIEHKFLNLLIVVVSFLHKPLIFRLMTKNFNTSLTKCFSMYD